MKNKKILTAVLICALVAAAASCGGNNNAATTTAAETTTTAATTTAETTTTTAATTTTEATTTTTAASEEEEEEEEAESDVLFTRGVYASYVGETLDSYFVFYNETEGNVQKADGMGGVAFSCEQNGNEIMFHFGAVDNETLATFEDDGVTGTFDYGEYTETYTFELVEDADPDTFEVTNDDGGMDSIGGLFHKGVWGAYEGDTLDSYFVFADETSGVIMKADGMSAVPFSCEQNGFDILFHIGSADNETYATFSTGDNTGTFDYGDGNVEVYYFEALPDEDPDAYLNSIAEASAATDAAAAAAADVLFDRGVYVAYLDGAVESYFVFYDQANGHIQNPEGIGVAFACEQNGDQILFHFGAADNNTLAEFDRSTATGTFDYGEGRVETYTFAAVPDADPDTFDATALQ